MSKGFGTQKQQDLSIDKALKFIRERSPERLDTVFNNTAPNEMELLMGGVVQNLQQEREALAWFFAYMAHEINTSLDNERENPIYKLALFLSQQGLRLFYDLIPLPGKVAIQPQKFLALPLEIQARVRSLFKLVEGSWSDLKPEITEWIIEPENTEPKN